MTVILMTHEAGADGDEVAAAIAQSLGIELVRREHLERQIAERLRIDEAMVRRMLAGNASLLERWTSDRGRLRRAMTEQVVRLAVQGDVLIQTWGIAPVLRPVRHVICLHLRAPVLARECLARRFPTMGEGGTAAETHGSEPVSLPIGRKFSHSRGDVELYDLVMSTDRICVAQCVEQVRRLTLDPLFQPTVASQSMLASLMRETGRSPQPIFGLGGTRVAPALQVLVGRDTIKLLPTISSEEAIARVEQHLRGRKDHAALDADEPSFSAQQANFELSTTELLPVRWTPT
jgi:cytidylate kinase-like protein